MFPFSGSRAELYLAARPPFTGIAKKKQGTGHGKQDQPIHLVLLCRFHNADHLYSKVNLQNLYKIHLLSKMGSLPLVSQQLYEPVSHVRCVEKDYLLLGHREQH